MTHSAPTSIIHRKARSGRAEYDARARSPAKALRMALARAADRLFDLPLIILGMTEERVSAPAVARAMGSDGLLILLDGAGEHRGAIAMDHAFVASLIEVQITGVVRPGAPDLRSFTATDAALMASFVDAVLEDMARELTDDEGARLRFGDRVEDSRQMGLALDGRSYILFALSVDIARGGRQGTVHVALPVELPATDGGDAEASQTSNMCDGLQANALGATALLEAVLDRVEQPLSEICSLKPGDRVRLSSDCLNKLALMAPGRHLVTNAHLGQMNGLRAVRLARQPRGREPQERPDEAPANTLPAPVQGDPAPEPEPEEIPQEAPVSADP